MDRNLGESERRELARIAFSIDPAPPFRLDLTVWAIRRRADNRIDEWDGETYRRVLAIKGKPVLVSVTQSGGPSTPRLHVTARAISLPAAARRAVINAVERLLGPHIDLRPFYELAAADVRLQDLAARFRGLKPPRFPTVWEGLVNGIACQQFSLAVGILLLNRLAAAFGLPLEREGMRHTFPTPEGLAGADPLSVQALGFNRAKTSQLIGLAKEIESGCLDVESFAALPNSEAIGELLQLRGVGRWTAEYVLLRGMGRIDVFPGDDVGARNNLSRWLRLRKPLDYGRVNSIVSRWRPFAGLIYFHLLLSALERAGHLSREITGASAAAGITLEHQT